MTPEAAFMFGSLTSFVITFVVLGFIVFRPRFVDLMAERDEWRNRAILVEDSADAQFDSDMALIGEWGNDAVPPDDWLV